MVLANVLRTDLHLYSPLSKESMNDARLKQITRAHKNLIRERVKLVNQLAVQLKSYYPVILQIFSNLDHEITLAFLQQYPSPEEAETASIEDLWQFFRKQRYCRPNRVPLIHELLHKPSLTAPRELVEIHESIVLSLVPVIRCLTIQVKNIEKKITSVFKENPSHEIFSSLPAGPIIAARLSGEIGSDGSRYPTPGYLQTEAGTAPVTRRSGKTIVVGFRWQCNKHLRDAFQGLARESIKRCPWARKYVANQMRLGHKPSRAYRALANRWAAIVWKMIQERSCFNQARLENDLIPATLVPSH
jgi:transposase